MYKTFLRSARNFDEMSKARKTTVSTGLTFNDAWQQARDYNNARNAKQLAKGTKMEFTET